MEAGLTLSSLDILFGFNNETSWSKSLNFCILHGKRFIRNSSMIDRNPLLFSFLLQIKSALTIEKTICTMNGNLEVFERDFGILFDAIG